MKEDTYLIMRSLEQVLMNQLFEIDPVKYPSRHQVTSKLIDEIRGRSEVLKKTL